MVQLTHGIKSKSVWKERASAPLRVYGQGALNSRKDMIREEESHKQEHTEAQT